MKLRTTFKHCLKCVARSLLGNIYSSCEYPSFAATTHELEFHLTPHLCDMAKSPFDIGTFSEVDSTHGGERGGVYVINCLFLLRDRAAIRDTTLGNASGSQEVNRP